MSKWFVYKQGERYWQYLGAYVGEYETVLRYISLTNKPKTGRSALMLSCWPRLDLEFDQQMRETLLLCGLDGDHVYEQPSNLDKILNTHAPGSWSGGAARTNTKRAVLDKRVRACPCGRKFFSPNPKKIYCGSICKKNFYRAAAAEVQS